MIDDNMDDGWQMADGSSAAQLAVRHPSSAIGYLYYKTLKYL